MKITLEQVKFLILSMVEEVTALDQLADWVKSDTFKDYVESVLEVEEESTLDELLNILKEYERELNDLRLEKFRTFENLRRAAALLAKASPGMNIDSNFVPEVVECAYINCNNTFLKDVANKLYCSGSCREKARKMRQRYGA